ncbi:hypothetical protein ACFWEJ_28690, partial [Promicromonospora sp. NPDC060204]
RGGVVARGAPPLLGPAYLAPRAVLGEHVRAVDPERYRARFRWITAHVEELRAAGRVRPDVDPEAVSLALSSVTIGLLSASALIGPLTPDRLRAALGVVEGLVREGIDVGPEAGTDDVGPGEMGAAGVGVGEVGADETGAAEARAGGVGRAERTGS